MEDEITALNDNDTYEDRQIVGENGSMGQETHKACYVAKNYSQIVEIDYRGTFAPTARMSSVRMP